jgi:alpha-beta hydrolase superfamily lysophospholipase
MKNILLTATDGKKFLADVFGEEQNIKHGIIVFAHGFKGFKDWGTFPLIAQTFADNGFVFVSFNFSHNGTTISNPSTFDDLDAFGNNNFTKELNDLGVVIDYVFDKIVSKVNLPVFLLGHSRGGGIAILRANEDQRISKVAVWGSVNQFGKFWKRDEMERMKRDGVIYISNARTNQQMPIYKQLYEDYENNITRLHIPNAVKNMKQPLLIVHGTADETVPYSAATEMHDWNANTMLMRIENGNHTFGGKHPWLEKTLPRDTLSAIHGSTKFFRE